ncbi:MAG: hypothetical protein RL264_338 [Bacteroidota bacterium]|jgi:glycosyltransferase involved in cell wall biosynthesis
MVSIAVVIITFNEERNLQRCLNSIVNVADEIVIVDSFSNDQTKEIALLFANVKFFQRKWDDYSQQKNFANQHVTSDYILWLDADEAVDEQLKNELLEIKESLQQPTLFTINRLTNYCGKWIRHSGWFPDTKIRMFPKNACRWDGATVHEELEIVQNFPQRQLSGLILHYSYYSHEQHQEKADNYSRLTAKKYAEQGKKAGFLKPKLSAIGRFLSMYVFKLGFLDGYQGFKIAQISARSNRLKYSELQRLNHEKKH